MSMNGTGRATENLTKLYIAIETRKDGVPLGHIMDGMGRTGVGITLLLVSLPALIPVPGPFGMVFGTIVALLAIQLMFGAHRLVLPAFVRSQEVPAGVLRAVLRKGLPLLQRAEKWMRPRRLLVMTRKWGRMAAGFTAALMGIAVALPVPTGNMLPVASLIALALGMLARDGGAVILGLALAVVAVAWFGLVFWFGAQMIDWLWSFVAM